MLSDFFSCLLLDFETSFGPLATRLLSSTPLLLEILEPAIELLPNAPLLLFRSVDEILCLLRAGPSFLLDFDPSDDDSLEELLESLESESELELLEELSSDELELEDDVSSEELSPCLLFFFISSSLNFSFFILIVLSFRPRVFSAKPSRLRSSRLFSREKRLALCSNLVSPLAR